MLVCFICPRANRVMGICFSSRRRATPPSTPSWSSDLPPELAGVVLRWLPSHADRVRFAAVCRHWGVAAQQQRPLVPPPLPWISFNNDRFQSLCDGEQHALRRWGPGYALRCYSTFGGWILLEMDDPARSCFLRNPFSGKSMKLPSLPFRQEEQRSDDPYARYRNRSAFRKVVSAGTGSGLIVAALFMPSMRENPKTIGICLPLNSASWALHTCRDGDGTWYEDVAFFRGKLYAVDNRGNLYAFDLATDDDDSAGGRSRPVIKVARERCLIQQAPRMEEPEPALAAVPQGKRRTTRRYLVASSDNDKLLMVRWSILEEDNAVFVRLVWPVNDEPVMAFSVFQAEHSNTDGGGTWAWSEVTSTGALEDQALFVSRSCSVALRASGYRYAGADVRGGRVFYLEDGGSASNVRYLTYMGFGRKWSLRVCGVYDLRPRDRTAGRTRLWDGGRRLWAEDRGRGGDGERTEFVPFEVAVLRSRATWFLPHACS